MFQRHLLSTLVLVETTTLLTGAMVALSATRTVAAPPADDHAAAVVVTAPAPLAVAVAAKPAPPTAKPHRPRPVVRHRTRSAPRTPAVRRTAVRRVAVTTKPLTGTLLMMAAVGRIPGYRTGRATWVMTSRYGSWGTADWYRHTVYISPRVPANRMYDVVAHEWSHLASVAPYPSVSDATAAMNAAFGGQGLAGAERAADCMAIQLGADWTHYTSCDNSAWQAAAARLLAGRRA